MENIIEYDGIYVEYISYGLVFVEEIFECRCNLCEYLMLFLLNIFLFYIVFLFFLNS